MTPEELRAFRESLGMSRREFAPKLFISEPTLERWERGQGGPREVHLHILRRMREHFAGGNAIGYFEYDASMNPPPAGLLRDQKELVTEALRGTGAVPLADGGTHTGPDWRLRFSPGWATGEPVRSILVCEGSERKERPVVDFTLEVSLEGQSHSVLDDLLEDVCFDHGVSYKLAAGSAGRVVALFRQRIFTTGLTAGTIRHVVGNFWSCWRRLEGALSGSHTDVRSETRGREVRSSV